MHSEGVTVKFNSTPPPEFVWISDKDMTEIELHSVDSISDLHRTHTEQHSKGNRPPRPQPPSVNGKLQTIDRPVFCQTGHRMKRSHLSPLSKLCSARWRYSLICLTVILILLTLILIFTFLVQQSSALHQLTEAMKQRQETAEELSLLIQQLQAQYRNHTWSHTVH